MAFPINYTLNNDTSYLHLYQSHCNTLYFQTNRAKTETKMNLTAITECFNLTGEMECDIYLPLTSLIGVVCMYAFLNLSGTVQKS